MSELLYTEDDLCFAVRYAKSEIERLNKALDFWKNSHMGMTEKLFAARQARDTAVDEYIKCEEKVIALTAENTRLKEISQTGFNGETTSAVMTGLGRTIQTLTAERDALRADAERYRWLRSTTHSFTNSDGGHIDVEQSADLLRIVCAEIEQGAYK